jgi:ribosomal-protein-alanine N-acetyltransferase
MQLPILDTARLRLMALRDQQAARLAELGNDPLIEAFTASMPSPYTLETAHAFIERSALAIERNENCVFGIHLRSNELVGVLNLRLQERHRSGHMGYWMGAAFRNRGLTTEAVREAVQFGFQTLQLHRIHTSCMAENHASARVLEKAGFEREGCSRQAFFKNGLFHDLLQFGAIAEHWQTR